MVVMPSTPVIFSLPFFFKGKIMEDSSDMTLPCTNDSFQIVLGVSLYDLVSVSINLSSQQSPNLDHLLR